MVFYLRVETVSVAAVIFEIWISKRLLLYTKALINHVHIQTDYQKLQFQTTKHFIHGQAESHASC